MLDIGVADEAARADDGILGEPGHLRDAGVEIARGIACGPRAGERRQIFGEREALGLRQRLLAEGALAFELCRRQRRQLQRRAQGEAAATEDQAAFDQRRHHDDARHRDALLALQRLRHLGGAEPAVAFAQDVFGRVAATVLGEIERDGLGQRLRVLAHTVERAAAVALGRAAPAGSDRIDQDQIGEGEPGVRVVLQAGGGGIVAGEVEDTRANQAEIQIRRRGAGSAIEREGDGTVRPFGTACDIGGVVDHCRALARLIEQRERARGRGIGELAARDVDAVLGDRIRRQQPQHAAACVGRALLGLSLFPLVRLGGSLLALLRRVARALLRACERGGAGDQQRQQQAPEAAGHGEGDCRRSHRGVLGRSSSAPRRGRTIAISLPPLKPVPRWTRGGRSGNVGLSRRPAERKIANEKHPAGCRTMPFPKASRALERFTVLDLTRVRAGPTCVRQLADWGANVIKIELPPDPGGGDQLGGPREGSDFRNLHRNKRSMTLNLKAPAAVAAFKRMVKKADVVVENFRPDVKRRLGIDYPQLRKINPKLVYASISGFGQTGPYANRPGFDQIAQGMGGLMSITGLPGQGPVRVGIPIADLCAGLFCALGILVALLEREKSKQGQHVTTSLLQAQIFMLDFQGARWLIDGEVPKQAGNNHPTSIPTGVFKTADGHINIASTGSNIWARFCNAAQASDLMQRPEYQTAAERSKHRDALNADMEKYTVKRTSAEWIELLNKAGVPCGPIYAIDEVYADPQVAHLGMAQSVKTKDKSTLRMAGQPMSLSRTPSRLAAPPPALGEHTDAVLKEFGFSAKEIAALRKANAV